MPQNGGRGYFPADDLAFGEQKVPVLQAAQQDIVYLLDRGYELSGAVTYTGNHFQLSTRQRTALIRSTATTATVIKRQKRMLTGDLAGATAYIDGFNLIILLEAAQCPQTTLLHCMDGALRDLCGLHSAYRLMDATTLSIQWITEALRKRGASRAVIYLDAPVSNSGKLRSVILAQMQALGMPCEVLLVPSADAMLWEKDVVISSDSNILDRCKSWVNLAHNIMADHLPQRRLIDLTQSPTLNCIADR